MFQELFNIKNHLILVFRQKLRIRMNSWQAKCGPSLTWLLDLGKWGTVNDYDCMNSWLLALHAHVCFHHKFPVYISFDYLFHQLMWKCLVQAIKFCNYLWLKDFPFTLLRFELDYWVLCDILILQEFLRLWKW